MPELSLNDIDRITRDIRREEINFSHLLEDLIDHICCDVEYEMSVGLSFNEAYTRVKRKMGSRRLKEIQEETLFAVDSKYRKMKTTMKIAGITGTVLFGFASLFKIQHWPGAGTLITLGALILALLFIPSALVVLWKETKSTKKLFLFLTAFITAICFIAGILFKVQHWPGSGLLMILVGISGILFIPALLLNRLNDQENKAKRPVYILGAAGSIFFIAGFLFKLMHWPFATLLMFSSIILLCIIALPWYTWITWKEEDKVDPMFIYIIIGSLLIIMPSALVSLNLQHSYQEYYYPNNYRQNALFTHLYRNNESIISRYHDSLNYQEIQQLHSRTTAIVKIIDNIQEKMVQESEGEPGNPSVSANQIRQTGNGIEINYHDLTKSLDPVPAKNFLLPGCSSREELDSSLKDYVNFLAGMVPAEGLKNYIKVLETEKFLPAGTREEGFTSLMTGLHSLEILKNGIMTVEASVLKDIISHN
jgi:hypothetical protein